MSHQGLDLRLSSLCPRKHGRFTWCVDSPETQLLSSMCFTLSNGTQAQYYRTVHHMQLLQGPLTFQKAYLHIVMV